MATVEELVRDILASVSSDAGGLLVAKWADNRYKEMVAKVRFRHLRKVGELSLPAVIDTGTVTTTRDSTAVTGDSTTFETDMSAGSQEDYYFRAGQNWYKIASVTDDTNLVLASGYAEDAVADGSYKIVKRTHALASDARWFGDFVLTRLRKRLTSISLDELDIRAPGRTIVGSIPDTVAQIAINSSGYPNVEIYPPPEESELIHYVYWSLPTALTMASTIPPVIDQYTLKEGTLIDLYRYEKAAAIRKGNIEQAAVWRNEEKSQESKWRQVINDAIRTSRGTDDISFILQMPNVAFQSRDQRTARDYILDNWSR
jgi:hypothetical protein